MQARRQRRGQRGRRETLDNKVPQANRETPGSRVMPAARVKRAAKAKRAETETKVGLEIRDALEIREGLEIKDVPGTRGGKARKHRVQPENIATQILTPEEPVALETTDLPGMAESRCKLQNNLGCSLPSIGRR